MKLDDLSPHVVNSIVALALMAGCAILIVRGLWHDWRARRAYRQSRYIMASRSVLR